MSENTPPNLTPNSPAVMQRLHQYITDTQLKPGDRLPSERKLACLFGVPRNCIRSAFRLMAEKGLVESHQGAGTYLKDIQANAFEEAVSQALNRKTTRFDEILELRMILETAVARLAAERWSQAQLDALKIIICDQQFRLLRNEADGDLDERFHVTLAACTQNSLLEEFMRQLQQLYRFGRVDDLRTDEQKHFSIASHTRIVNALESHNVAECEKEIREHLDTVIKTHPFSSKKEQG